MAARVRMMARGAVAGCRLGFPARCAVLESNILSYMRAMRHTRAHDCALSFRPPTASAFFRRAAPCKPAQAMALSGVCAGARAGALRRVDGAQTGGLYCRSGTDGHGAGRGAPCRPVAGECLQAAVACGRAQLCRRMGCGAGAGAGAVTGVGRHAAQSRKAGCAAEVDTGSVVATRALWRGPARVAALAGWSNCLETGQ